MVAGKEKNASNQFLSQMGRLKEAVGVKTDFDLAKVLGIKHTSVASARERMSIPPKWFVEISDKHRISSDWLLYGEGPMRRGEVQEPSPAAPGSPLDHELLRHVIEGVEDGLSRRHLTLSPDKKARLIDLLYEHFHKTQELPQAQMVDRFLKLVA